MLHSASRLTRAASLQVHMRTLAWCGWGGEWRTLNPSERAQAHGFPPEVVQAAGTSRRTPMQQRTALQNSLIGSGPHLPSLMAVLLLAVQLLPMQAACDKKLTLTPRDQADLCARLCHTFLDERVACASPHLLSAAQITEQMRLQFSGIYVDEGVWSRLGRQLAGLQLWRLQSFSTWLWLRGKWTSSQGPSWVSQRDRAYSAATLGHQRAASNSSHGLNQLLPAGLLPNAHTQRAAALPNPFSFPIEGDLDTRACAEAIAIMGPYLPSLRHVQLALFQQVADALRPLDVALRTAMPPSVAAIASSKSPALLAFLTATLQWPDRAQARSYVEGFPIIGNIPDSGTFRQLSPQQQGISTRTFFGTAAVNAVDEIEAMPPPKHAEVIWKLCLEDVEKGFASPPVPRAAMDRKFGRGLWRPLVRFAITQASGKVRGIDDAKRTKHNEHSVMSETIYTIGADWAPETCALVLQALHRHWPELKEDPPDWAQLALATVDLPDAYRGCPVCPDQQGASVVAAWDPQEQMWYYMPLHGLAFGLSSAVVSFNRLPTLLAAAARRMHFVLLSAYFDDLPVLDVAAGGQSAMIATTSMLVMAGAPPGEDKVFPFSQYRTFLGVDVRVPEAMTAQRVHLAPLSRTVQTICSTSDQALKESRLSPGSAAKLRGQLGWASSNSFGRCGRLATFALKQRQFATISAMNASLRDALVFIRALAGWLPAREVDVSGRSRPVIVAYSDAEFTPGSGRPPRLGWLLFLPGSSQPLARTCLLSTATVNLWRERTQQIYPAETFAVLAALRAHGDVCRGQDLLWFVDNEAACSTLIRGASRQEDVQHIAELTHFECLRLQCRIWFEWVDSKSNPSDGLSRLGLRCPSFGYLAEEAAEPPWTSLLRELQTLGSV